MKRFTALSLGLFLLIAPASSDERSTFIDFFLVIDTSLSMADAIDEARNYAAGEVVGRLAVPGDWVSAIRFYGESSVVWSGDINGEADKAALVRSLVSLRADGRFTDIGAALDFLDRAVLARGRPDRPKYILLITDERQEAPAGSPYYSADFTVSHPLLQYVRRQDLGKFRVLTIGYGIAGKVEGEARSLMTTLSEPPARPSQGLPGAPGAGTAGGEAGDGAASGGRTDGSGAPGEAAAGRLPGWLYVAAPAALAAAAILIIVSRRRRDRDEAGGKGGRPA